jgi:hypothetical protein
MSDESFGAFFFISAMTIFGAYCIAGEKYEEWRQPSMGIALLKSAGWAAVLWTGLHTTIVLVVAAGIYSNRLYKAGQKRTGCWIMGLTIGAILLRIAYVGYPGSRVENPAPQPAPIAESAHLHRPPSSPAHAGIPFVAPEGVSFQVPDGWNQIPLETLLARAHEMRSAAPNSAAPTPSYGFTPSKITDSVWLPNVMVAFTHGVQLTEADLRSQRDKILEIQKSVNRNLEGNSVGAGATVEGAVYDENRHFLRVEVRGRADDTPIRSVLATFPASMGPLFFLFTAKEYQYQSQIQVFEEILDSVRVQAVPRHQTASPQNNSPQTAPAQNARTIRIAANRSSSCSPQTRAMPATPNNTFSQVLTIDTTVAKCC